MEIKTKMFKNYSVRQDDFIKSYFFCKKEMNVSHASFASLLKINKYKLNIFLKKYEFSKEKNEVFNKIKLYQKKQLDCSRKLQL